MALADDPAMAAEPSPGAGTAGVAPIGDRHGGWRAAARRLRPTLAPLAMPVTLYLLSRVGVLLIASSVAYDSHLTFAQTLLAWDGKWYMAAALGYPHHNLPGSGNSAQNALGFFPGLPILIALVHVVLRIGVAKAGLLVTFATGLSASVSVWLFLRDTETRDGADLGTALVVFSPAAFVFSMVYSEGLLITASALCFVMLRRRRWVAAGLLAAVASATDPLGFLMVLPCAVAAWTAIRDGSDRRAIVAPVLAPMGAIGFFAFLWVWVGTPFAWFIAQHRGWQGGVPVASIPGEFAYLFQHGFSDVNDTIKAASFLVLLALLVVFIRIRPWPPVTAFVVGALVVAAASPIIGWTPRVALRAFPLLAVVGARIPRRWSFVVVGVSALLLAAVEAAALGAGVPPFTP